MATKTFQVQTYKVSLSRLMTAGAGGRFYGIVECRGGDGHRFAIYFVRPDSADLDNVYNVSAKWGTCFVPAEQLPWYVDLLRNEKPVYAYLNSDNPHWNQLRTSLEPVGEEES